MSSLSSSSVVPDGPESKKAIMITTMTRTTDGINKDEVSTTSNSIISKANVPPRKRSKVSRACDACRRKKVRCDAEFSQTSNSVTKICTNCTKINENCTFSRVPLKRGPSKGYIRDLEERIESSQKIQNNLVNVSHSHKKSLDSGSQAIQYSSASVPPPPPPHLNHNLIPTIQSNSSLSMSSSQPQIILPPLNLRSSFSNGLRPATVGHKSSNSVNDNGSNNSTSNSNSNPASPKAGLTSSYMHNVLNPELPPKQAVSQSNQQQQQHHHQQPQVDQTQKQADVMPQGHFWKVPYELPFNRRGSVDSIASSVSEVSNSKFPNLANSLSNSSVSNNHTQYESSAISDSDDDYHSTSQRFSQSLSPRNSITSNNIGGRVPTSPALSISSLSSLNGKLSKNLNIQNPSQQSITSVVPPMIHPINKPTQNQIFQSMQQSIDANSNYYYLKFHKNFPILPFNSTVLKNMIQRLNSDDESKLILDIFDLSLQCLKNYSVKSISDIKAIYSKITGNYPFENRLSDKSLTLLLSSLVILNYSVLLNGDNYLMGISIGFTIFNDYKIFENFLLFLNDNNALNENFSNNPDDVKFYLPKLYIALVIIDNISSLSFGTPKQTCNYTNEFLIKNLNYLIPINSNNLIGLNNFKVGIILDELIKQRDFHKINILENKNTKDSLGIIWENYDLNNISGISGLFIIILKEKLELFDSLKELKTQLFIRHTIDEEEEDLIFDYQLKICRIAKKTTLSIINFLNNSSSLMQQSFNKADELLLPMINLIYGQLYKLILVLKLIVDSLSLNVNNNDLTNRCNKTSNDLSVANNLINLIKLPISNSFQISVKARQRTLNLNNVSFNFNNLSAKYDIQSSEKLYNMNNWIKSITNEVLPIIENENYDGFI